MLRRAGRQRTVSATAAKIRATLTSEQLTARPGVVPAYAASAAALIVDTLSWRRWLSRPRCWLGSWSRVLARAGSMAGLAHQHRFQGIPRLLNSAARSRRSIRGSRSDPRRCEPDSGQRAPDLPAMTASVSSRGGEGLLHRLIRATEVGITSICAGTLLRALLTPRSWDGWPHGEKEKSLHGAAS